MSDSKSIEIGFRTFTFRPWQEGNDPAQLIGLDVASVADAMNGFNCMDGLIMPIVRPTSPLVGPALTVTITPGNGRMIRHAMRFARPGDIIVVNGYGATGRSVMGGNVAVDLLSVGLAGIIIDGVVRDVAELREVGLPVFARGTSPRAGSDEVGRGEVLGPIACGGCVVMPGDAVVASDDGVVVVPMQDIASVAALAGAIQTRREPHRERETGVSGRFKSFDEAQLDASLRAAGHKSVERPWGA